MIALTSMSSNGLYLYYRLGRCTTDTVTVVMKSPGYELWSGVWFMSWGCFVTRHYGHECLPTANMV